MVILELKKRKKNKKKKNMECHCAASEYSLGLSEAWVLLPVSPPLKKLLRLFSSRELARMKPERQDRRILSNCLLAHSPHFSIHELL